MSRGPIPDFPRDRPSVADVRPFVQSIYARHCAGCCLHIALDDGNLSNHNVEFCLKYAREREHQDCESAAMMLLMMTPTQRRRVYRDPLKRALSQ